MEKRTELYRGKAKSVYTTDDPDRLILIGVSHGAEHHGAEAVGADLDAGAAKRTILHLHTLSSW